MAKQKKMPLKGNMVMSNEKLILLGIVIGIVLTMVYVKMTGSKENLDASIQPEFEASTQPPETTTFAPLMEITTQLPETTTFPPMMEITTQLPETTTTPPVTTTIPPTTDGSVPTSFKKWATLAVGKQQKPVKSFQKDWVKQRTKCQKSRNTFSEYNPNFQKKLIKRSQSGLGGECWDLNNEGQTTHLCCNFKV